MFWNRVFTMAHFIRDHVPVVRIFFFFSTPAQEQLSKRRNDNIPTPNWSDSRTQQKGSGCITLVTESLTLIAGTFRVPLAFILYRLWTPVVVSSEIPLIPVEKVKGFTSVGVNADADQHIKVLGASSRGLSWRNPSAGSRKEMRNHLDLQTVVWNFKPVSSPTRQLKELDKNILWKNVRDQL